MSEKELLHARLNRHKEFIDKKVEKLHRLIDKGVIGGEAERLWLDQFTKGRGLDICCGDFPMENSIGIDMSIDKIGASYHFILGDEIVGCEKEELDFIVCNYFDCFPTPLKVLHEWERILKPGGVIAFIACNAEAYENFMGPMTNKNRQSCYTDTTITCYLQRAGFKEIEISKVERALRVKAVKV